MASRNAISIKMQAEKSHCIQYYLKQKYLHTATVKVLGVSSRVD